MDTTISSTNKTGRYDITEILLKVVLNTITLTLKLYTVSLMKFNMITLTLKLYTVSLMKFNLLILMLL